MNNCTKIVFFMSAVLVLTRPALAVDINLFNVDMGGSDNQRLSQAYGDAYGFPANQVAPALSGPAEEVPAIMQIAQAAGTVPTSVWMMRRMGMSYGRILQNFALAPTALMGSGMPSVPSLPTAGLAMPRWNSFRDPYLVQTARVTYLRDVLQVNPVFIPQIPYRGPDFHRAILYPVPSPRGAWMPPGIAKKYGLWMPPGQAKKYGYNRGGMPNGKWEWDDHDERGKWEGKKGKHKGKGHGKHHHGHHGHHHHHHHHDDD